MKTKEQILNILEKNKGEYISGEALAKQLGISRAAVSKAVKSLKNEGYKISAVTNKGYNLESENDLLSKSVIETALKEQGINCAVNIFKTLSSTNDTAKQIALDPLQQCDVVIADEQTGGKGRLGRKFFSPAGTGIYMSIIIKPKFNIEKSLLITTASSVAVCRAIEALSAAEPKIKWVNDVYIGEKKICGILTEAVTNFENGNIDFIVVGIGINFKTADFPSELSPIASAVFNNCDTQASRNQLISRVLIEFYKILDTLDDKSFMEEYKKRSMILGKEINVITFNDTYPATAIDIDENGALIIQTTDKKTCVLNTGEVSIRLK